MNGLKSIIDSGDFPVLKDLIDNSGGKIEYTVEGSLNTEDNWVKLILKTKYGKQLGRAKTKVSAEKALSSLEKQAREKLNEEWDENHPWDKLTKQIRLLTLLDTGEYGSDKIGGYRIGYYPSYKTDYKPMAIIGIKNAGNDFLMFDPLGTDGQITMKAAWIGHHLTGGNTVLKLFELINNYLYIDVEIRRAEFEAIDTEKKEYMKK